MKEEEFKKLLFPEEKIKEEKDPIYHYKKLLYQYFWLGSDEQSKGFRPGLLRIRKVVLDKIGKTSLIQLEHDAWVNYWGRQHKIMPKNFRLGIIKENGVPSNCIDAVIKGLSWVNRRYFLEMNIEIIDPNSKEYQTEIQRLNSALKMEDVKIYDSSVPNGSYCFVSRRSFGSGDWGGSHFHGNILLELIPERQKYLDAITGVSIHEVITHFLGFGHHEFYSLEDNYGYRKDDFCVTRYDCLSARKPCQRCDEAINLLLR